MEIRAKSLHFSSLLDLKLLQHIGILEKAIIWLTLLAQFPFALMKYDDFHREKSINYLIKYTLYCFYML